MRRAGGEGLPPRAPGDVLRQQASLERGRFGRDAWREVRCPTHAEGPRRQVPEVSDRRREKGTEVCDRPVAPRPPAARPGAAWGPVTCQGARSQGPRPLGGQVCPETGVQPQEGEQAQPDRPPLPRKCGCDSRRASFGQSPLVAEESASPGPSQDRDAEALASPDPGPFAGRAVLTQLVLPSKLEKPRLPPEPLTLLRPERGAALRCGVWGLGLKEGAGGAGPAVCTQHPTEGLAEPRLTYAGKKAEVKGPPRRPGSWQEAGLRQRWGDLIRKPQDRRAPRLITCGHGVVGRRGWGLRELTAAGEATGHSGHPPGSVGAHRQGAGSLGPRCGLGRAQRS